MNDRPEKIDLSDIKSRKVDENMLNELRDLFEKADEQKERYDFTWNGKAKAYFEAASPSTKTLKPNEKESVDFKNSENLFITGDNLEALKLMQESYLGKVDFIYIDPPYNTGKDFVYHDDFRQKRSDADFLEGKLDENGDKLIKSDRTSGRYHSDWLSMMYPRIKLSRNLLSEKGVFFASIDDNEQANLKLLMDEIFGEDNFVANVTREAKTTSFRGNFFAPSKDSLLVYAKDIKKLNDFYGEIDSSQYKKIEKDGPKKGEKYRDDIAFYLSTLETRPNQRYFIEAPDGELLLPPGTTFPPASPSDGDGVWRWNKKTYSEKKDYLVFKKSNRSPLINNYGKKAKWNIYTKSYISDKGNKGNIPRDLITGFLNRNGSEELKKIEIPFSFPKPSSLIKFLIKISIHSKDALILDFFAGSGTTADAVMQLNNEDGGRRKYVVVTLNEKTSEKSDAKKEGYSSIDQIAKERIRRSAKNMCDDSGFKSLNIVETSLNTDIFKRASELSQYQLTMDIDNNSDNRSDYELLYDVLISSAFEYNRPISIDNLDDERIIKYDYFGELSGVVAYFGDNLTDDLIRKIASLKPLIAVFKESTFEKSSQKVNLLEQFRITSPDTKVKVI
ncbi:site-specific DNA-methyltransferase [Apilactobacillus kunkeei]|uniref:DNA methylase n=1 Tax=Apilactobacillus kunkeei TaxID=148814 RepID=A0A1L8CIB6_9LACO|nr:site-specific DNA-methyltransferase [Apilactobacillus kunkeei]GAT90922.1 DNA methylase [Apilactobacillus kunkeei]